MANKRFDHAPKFVVKDDAVVIQQAVGSSAPLLDVKDHTGSSLMSITSAGAMAGASLTSPVLTGTPTAPTAAAGTNTTQVATTAFVQTGLTNLLVSPTFTGTVLLPSTTSIGTVSSTEIGYLDGVTSSLQTQLNAKAPTDNPVFTGNATFDTDTLFVYGANNVVGIGTSSPSLGQYGDFALDVYGRIRIRGGKAGGTAGIALGTAVPTSTYYDSVAFVGMVGTADSSDVGFYHSGQWRVLVDNAGRVRTPHQPFYYGQHAGGNVTYTGIYNPGTVRINVGSRMNTSNGRFTPGVAGYVLCSFSSLINTPLNNSHFFTYFTVNGSEVSGRIHTDYAQPRSYEPISHTAIVYVGASDFVECYVQCQESAAIYGAPWGGELMYAFLG